MYITLGSTPIPLASGSASLGSVWPEDVYGPSTVPLRSRYGPSTVPLRCLQVYDLPFSFARKICKTMQKESETHGKNVSYLCKHNMTESSVES